MTDQDREKVLAVLAESDVKLRAAVDGLTQAQWQWKPEPERWSIAETTEHIVVVEPFLFSRVQQAIGGGVAEDAAERTAGKAEMLENIMVGRRNRVTAPPPVVPKGGARVDELLSTFAAQRSAFHEYITACGDDLHCYTADHRFPPSARSAPTSGC